MTKEELAALKPGDRVWLGDSRQPHREGTRPVTKVTRTLITVGGRRFKRINGFAWGYGSCWITALATPAECAAWDAEQVTKAGILARDVGSYLMELKRDRERLEWVFSLNGASIEEIEAILMHTDTPDQARASIDAMMVAREAEAAEKGQTCTSR